MQQRLTCPVCGRTDFEERRGRIDGRHVQARWKVLHRICTHCGYVLTFDERTISQNFGQER